VTPRELRGYKGQTVPLAWVTAYDYPTARLAEEAGVDAILVGDSLGNVVLGYPTTLPVTLEDMVRAGAAVARGAPRTLRVVDLPYLAYVTPEEAVRSAGRLMVEGGAHAVKLEGGRRVRPQVEALVAFGIPVVGHLGYTPQSSPILGRQVQGRGSQAAQQLVEDARALADAGVVALVLEMVPAELAERVTQEVPVPTIGIGAGQGCDGQVLVLHDVVGLNLGRVPRLAKRYGDAAAVIREAVGLYVEEVRARKFPAEEHTFHDTPSGPGGEGRGEGA
jgi:3-methyl-2-oxobutanoate hydroxymethyltransferase